MTTRDEARAYARGYAAGMRRSWPAYHPPIPPDAVSGEIVKSAQALGQKVAEWCGAFGDDDEFSVEMSPLIKAVDDANEKLTKWLCTAEGKTARTEPDKTSRCPLCGGDGYHKPCCMGDDVGELVEVETTAASVTTFEAVGNGLCKRCGLSWYLHIDDQGRSDVCTSLRPSSSESM